MRFVVSLACARVVDKQIVLGTPLGRHVAVAEFLAKPLNTMFARIAVYKTLRISLGMRVLVANTFLIPLFSYVTRIVLIPTDLRQTISNAILRFVSPVPMCKLLVFSHLRTIFKVPLEVKDLLLSNVAALLSTAFRLQCDRKPWGRLMHEWDHVQTWGGDPYPGCPMTSVASAYVFFRSKVGETFDSFTGRMLRRASDGNANVNVHVATYRALLKADECTVRDELGRRFHSKGLDGDKVFTNMKRMPSSTPAGHALFMFRVLLNGLPTSRRTRFFSSEPVKNCCFCEAPEGDSQHHWAVCSKLRFICARLYENHDIDNVVSLSALMLQIDFDGEQLQRVVAFWCAVWKVRNVIVHGLKHTDDNDLLHHFMNIIADPWLIGHPEMRSRAERRQKRMRAPQMLRDWWVYNSDGGARSQPDASYKASYGVQLSVNEAVVAKVAVYIGDRTNNVAEYRGVLAALQHALANATVRVCFRVDSKLVCEQLCGRWACRSLDLIPLYETCLPIVGELKSILGAANVIVEHVYREYNVGADSLANIAIDNHNQRVHFDGVVVSDNWAPFANPM